MLTAQRGQLNIGHGVQSIQRKRNSYASACKAIMHLAQLDLRYLALVSDIDICTGNEAYQIWPRELIYKDISVCKVDICPN